MRVFSILLSLFLILNLPSFSQVDFTESNLPIVVIDTDGQQIPDEPRILAHMGIIDNGPGQINSINDPANDYDGNIGIELRGSSSLALYDKKSYRIELWDSVHEDLNVPILGMPEEDDWVLHGPYGDKSLIRNVLAFKLARDQGRYASRTRICELVINDQYRGVYVFMEKIKRDPERVDISKLNPDEVSGDDLTGGYIVKVDKFDGNNSGEGWISPYPPYNRTRDEQVIFFQYDYPKRRNIVPEQEEYIKNYVTAFEKALRTKSFQDNITGYKAYIDVESFVDYAIINELTRNIDAYRLSTFLHKDKDSQGGKLFMGPIWDYNLAFGNADYCNGWQSEGWAWDFNQVCNEDFWLIPFWWQRFFSDTEFTNLLNDRWQELRNGPYKTEVLMSYIDSVANDLSAAQERNFTRWNILGTYVWPNNFVGDTYGQEVDYLKNWLSDRLDWLDLHFSDIITEIERPPLQTSSIQLYPNPFQTELKIRSRNTIPKQLTIEVFNLVGEKIADHVLNHNEQEEQVIWSGYDNTGNKVNPGIYYVTIKSNGKKISSAKIIRK